MSCMLGSVFSEVCSPCSWISGIRDVSPTPSAGVALRSGVALGMGATLGVGAALRLGVVLALVLCSIVAGLTEDRIWIIFSFRKVLKLRRVRAYIKKFAIMFRYVRLRHTTIILLGITKYD